MSMAYAAIQVLDKNTLIWNGVPAMVQAHTEFKANLTALEGAVVKQVADIKGHAKDKAAAEEKMITKTLAMAGDTLATVHLLREPRHPYDTRVEVWLDPARHHLPVRATMGSGDEDRLELRLREAIP